MKARIIRYLMMVNTVLVGLSAGLSLSHLLEAPGKHSLTGAEFLQVQHTFYGGYAIFGAVVWIVAPILSLVALIALVRSLTMSSTARKLGRD